MYKHQSAVSFLPFVKEDMTFSLNLHFLNVYLSASVLLMLFLDQVIYVTVKKNEIMETTPTI